MFSLILKTSFGVKSKSVKLKFVSITFLNIMCSCSCNHFIYAKTSDPYSHITILWLYYIPLTSSLLLYLHNRDILHLTYMYYSI
ncbi:hypothetical protein BDF21DRAFT_425769 [Thamnidium elegans]|nr:hypothetical protein BDF21DRAFT_425769 [Thamnidium elegans]